MDTPLDLVASVDWLAARAGDDDIVVVDVRPADQYAAGHIPNARSLDLYPMKILDSDPTAIASWVKSIEAAFGATGIRQGDRVVFYEDISGTTAARGVWIMHALGFGEGAMLDGGLEAWRRGGNPVSTDPVRPAPSRIEATLDPGLFATAPEVLEATGREGTEIIDTRADQEWAQGTIPSARHLEWTHHLRPDGTLKPREALHALYQDAGLTTGREIITFCASGYRAAHTWLVLRLLGYDRVRNYAPSWGEWGRRSDLPVAPTR